MVLQTQIFFLVNHFSGTRFLVDLWYKTTFFSGQPLFSNQISRTTFLKPLFYTFLEKWLQNEWSKGRERVIKSGKWANVVYGRPLTFIAIFFIRVVTAIIGTVALQKNRNVSPWTFENISFVICKKIKRVFQLTLKHFRLTIYQV